ncbi:hypothetical protein M5K25_022773 [Dendrobium thyrsiflorum]|uniref:Uncharacterized protein n=1 Tax=Dendrobium thyrsiflorum TaxID=117978 RepID=A0ABD0U7A0_DENTH
MSPKSRTRSTGRTFKPQFGLPNGLQTGQSYSRIERLDETNPTSPRTQNSDTSKSENYPSDCPYARDSRSAVHSNHSQIALDFPLTYGLPLQARRSARPPPGCRTFTWPTTTVLPTSVAKSWSLRPPAPVDNGLFDLRRPLTMVLSTSFADYGPFDLRRQTTSGSGSAGSSIPSGSCCLVSALRSGRLAYSYEFSRVILSEVMATRKNRLPASENPQQVEPQPVAIVAEDPPMAPPKLGLVLIASSSFFFPFFYLVFIHYRIEEELRQSIAICRLSVDDTSGRAHFNFPGFGMSPVSLQVGTNEARLELGISNYCNLY